MVQEVVEAVLHRRVRRVVTPVTPSQFPMTGRENIPRHAELCRQFAEELQKLEQQSGPEDHDHSNGNDTEEHAK